MNKRTSFKKYVHHYIDHSCLVLVFESGLWPSGIIVKLRNEKFAPFGGHYPRGT